MLTPDVQMPVVEALIQWLNPKWFMKMVDGDFPEGLVKKNWQIEKEVFSFSDDVYYILYLILDEGHDDGPVWMKPEKLIGESEKELGRFNPFIDGNYQLQPANYEEFENNRGGIYLTREQGSDYKILWLPKCVLAENGGFTVDSGFENQRYEYMDIFPERDRPDIFLVSDYLGPKSGGSPAYFMSRDLLNWEKVPETLLRRSF